MTKKEMIAFLENHPDDTELALLLHDRVVPLDDCYMVNEDEPKNENDWPIGTIIFFVD